MANLPDTSPTPELVNREILTILRSLINARPGLNRLVTSIAIDDSESAGDECVVVVRISRAGVGFGGGNTGVTGVPGQAKTKIVGDETVAASDGPGAADMAGQPQGVTNE